MKFPINDFFGKYDQIRSFLRNWSHLLKKSLMENFIFCAVNLVLINKIGNYCFLANECGVCVRPLTCNAVLHQLWMPVTQG